MEVDLTALAKATVKTEDFAEETETDDGSGETKEVDLMAVAKETAGTEAGSKKNLQRKHTYMIGMMKQRRLI